MGKPKLPPGQAYTGRPSMTKVLNISIDRDADDILRRYAGDGMRPIGRFIERLIFEFAARQEERAKMQAEQAAK